MTAKQQAGLPTRVGRGLIAVLIATPLVLAGFVAGYGIGVQRGETGSETAPAWEDGDPGETAVLPDVASFTASDLAGPALPAPPAMPVGYSDDIGVAVAHLQFTVDESFWRSGHTAHLRLPMSVAPQGRPVLVEVASVRAAECLCALTGESSPPFGAVWDTDVAGPDSTELVFDVTGAFDAPGRYGFAVTTPDVDAYFELEGLRSEEAGPSLRTFAPSGTADLRTPDPGAEDVANRSGDDRRPAWLPESHGQAETNLNACTVGEKLVPTCGMLIGAAAGAHTSQPKHEALLEFEQLVGRTQHIYHAYQRADGDVFPTPEQIALARDPDNPRVLFLNWKPQIASWAKIAAGDQRVDAYLDRLAEHLTENFTEPFFFTVHHEPENDVIQRAGSGYEAADYAAMYRYVIEYLRDQGVDNLVTVMNYMSYMRWTSVPWHGELYPGDDVVDWVGWSGYGHSTGGGDPFPDIVNEGNPEGDWPGYYHWAATTHPNKPVMLAEWGVFHHRDNPDHQRKVFEAVEKQLGHYPRLKAIVYFESPNAEGRNSKVDTTPETLQAFRDLMRSRHFEVALR